MFWWLKKNKETEIKLINDSFLIFDDAEIFINEDKWIDIKKIVIIKLGRESCPACKMFRYPLKTFEINNKDNVETYELDIDENPNLSRLLNLRWVPANMIFQDGKLLNIITWADLNSIAIFIHSLWYSIK